MTPGPPTLATRHKIGFRRNAALWLLGSVVLMLGAWAVTQTGFLMPPCGLKTFTGVPCPFCGGTRSAAALAQFHFTEALRLNPLVTLGLLAAVALSLLTMILPAGSSPREGWRGRIIPRLRRYGWPLGLAVVGVNWLYVILTLP